MSSFSGADSNLRFYQFGHPRKFPVDASATACPLPDQATKSVSNDASAHAAVVAHALASGQAWLNDYNADVQKVQQLKQHHVHILNEETGEREPLTHCRRADNPNAKQTSHERYGLLMKLLCSVRVCCGACTWQ